MSDDLDDLRERADLLAIIARAEQQADWTPIEELRERAALLQQIAEAETESRRNLTTVDASRAAHRITVAADVILAIERKCAA